MSTIKMRSKEANGVVTVKALIKHPMETGARKNKKTGDMIPAHYIQEVHSKANNNWIYIIPLQDGRLLTAYGDVPPSVADPMIQLIYQRN